MQHAWQWLLASAVCRQTVPSTDTRIIRSQPDCRFFGYTMRQKCWFLTTNRWMGQICPINCTSFAFQYGNTVLQWTFTLKSTPAAAETWHLKDCMLNLLTYPQAGGPPLFGCLRLLIQFIRSYPPYRRPFLDPQPEDAPCRGDRDPLITWDCMLKVNVLNNAVWSMYVI